MEWTEKDNRKDIIDGIAAVSVVEENYSFITENNAIRLEGYESEKDYKPSKNTNIVIVNYSNSRPSAATVKAGSILDADILPDRYELYAFFRAYDVDDADDFDLYAEKSNVKDIVLFRFNSGDVEFNTTLYAE